MSPNSIQNGTQNVQMQIQPQRPNIAIVDNFTQKFIFADWDNTPDIAHGKFVERLIQEKLPDAQIDEFEVKPCDEKSFISSIDNVINNIKSGKKYDAMNLSMSDNISFSSLSKSIGKTISAENLKEHKSQIKDWLNNLTPDDTIVEKKPFGSCADITNKTLKASYTEVIQKLEQISSSGTKIYIAAGNNGKNYLNLASLADNVTTVGSTNSQGEKSSFSADNSLVSGWAQGEFKVKKIKDDKTSGFDLTEDGKIDISSDRTSAFFKLTSDKKIEGTSFATPKKLAQDLTQ